MKICFLIHDLDLKAGWGRYALEIINRIKQKNIEIEIFSEIESGDGRYEGWLKNSLANPFFVFWHAWQIRRYLKDCDVIHCFDGYPYGLIGALANIGLHKKLIINGVGTYSVLPLDQKIKSWFLRWAYRRADKILCISQFTLNEIKKRMPELNNLEVVHLGVDFNKFKNQNTKYKMTMQNLKIIISVGALKKRKGYHVSIPAAGIVMEKIPNLKYYIVGNQADEKYFSELKNLVEKYNLKDNVEFLENVSDEQLAELYNQADLFLLTPINDSGAFEGFGLVYLEANACGKPVVGTYGCGAEDAIDDGKTGFLVSPNDIEKTAETILKILGDENLARQMGEDGRKKAKAMSWDKTIEKYLKIYQETNV